MKTLKALSIQQPWAWALFHGKPVENRTWYSKYRGDLLIHASSNFDVFGYRWLIKQNGIATAEIPRPEDYIRSAIIGKVTMIDCVVSYPSLWFFGPYGFVFSNPVKFKKPIPFKGALRFFDVPDELINEQPAICANCQTEQNA